MKKVSIWFVVVMAFAMLMMSSCSYIPSARQQAVNQQKVAAQTAINSIPIPQVSYFAERRTIAKWVERWDKPNVPTYTYIISFGKVLGYYVCDGKPASTQSYLVPEETVGGGSNGYYVMSAPDIDGTYGTNPVGWRFFTASGVAVEWSGEGANILYSDAPLPLEVPLLGK